MTDNFNYNAIRTQCRVFTNNHPLEGDSPMVVKLKMDDVMKKIAEKMAEKNEGQSQSEVKLKSQQSTLSTKNSGCMLIIGLILFHTLLL